VGSLGLGLVFEGGLVIAPNGTAYATNEDNAGNPRLFTVDLDTAATMLVGTISGPPHDINGLAWRSDGMLVGLDRESNSLLAIDPATAASSPILGVASTVGAIGGMAAIGDSGFFATSGPSSSPSGSNTLYSFDLNTGAHLPIGSFPANIGTGIGGLALIPIPEPSTLLIAGLAFAWGLCRSPRRRA
jgi:hypothetical protein